MADDRELAEATASLSFAEFLEKMKDPAAADLVRSIKNFIKTYEERKVPDPEADSHLVQQFLAKSEGAFRQHPVWASGPSEHQAQAIEGLEKYLMTKIYHKAFAVSAVDKERDEALSTRMQALNFIRPEHLDIPLCFQDERAWLLAQKELHKINSYKAPRDKLVCVLNCCRIINNLLHTSNTQGEARGADDFLPILIYIVIHANPPQLSSNLEYIQRFRMQSRMVSESSYFFTQLYSAASFIETINTNSLTMDADEFVARMVAAGVPDMQLLPEPQRKPTPFKPLPRLETFKAPSGDVGAVGPTREPVPQEALHPGASVPTLNASSLAQLARGSPDVMPLTRPSAGQSSVLPSQEELERLGIQQVVSAEASGELRNRHPYIYASADDLRIADVESMLAAYKHLVLRFEALSMGIAAHRSTVVTSPIAHHGFADAPPAINGPNPFAGGPDPFGDQPPPYSPIHVVDQNPVRSPRAQPVVLGQGSEVGAAARPLRLAESNPFPSLAASHRQSLDQAHSASSPSALPQAQPKLDLMSGASLVAPVAGTQPPSVPVPQPNLSPITSGAAQTSAAAAAFAAVTASRALSGIEHAMLSNAPEVLNESRLLSTIRSGDVSPPAELQAHLREGWSKMAEHGQTGATSPSANADTQPAAPSDSLATSQSKGAPQTGVEFPLCPIPSLFDQGGEPQGGEASLSHLSKDPPDPSADAPGPPPSSEAPPPPPSAVTFPEVPSDLASPFDNAESAGAAHAAPSKNTTSADETPVSNATSAEAPVSNAHAAVGSKASGDPPPSQHSQLREGSVGMVMTGFGGSPFADSANDSFTKSNSTSADSTPRAPPANLPPSDSLI